MPMDHPYLLSYLFSLFNPYLYHFISFYIILYLCDHAISRFLELDGLPTWQFSSKVRSRWGKNGIWELGVSAIQSEFAFSNSLGIRQLVEEFWGNGWETDQVHWVKTLRAMGSLFQELTNLFFGVTKLFQVQKSTVAMLMFRWVFSRLKSKIQLR